MARETLNSLMLSIARKVLEPFEGTATGGSATTLVDSARSEADDFFNIGTLFFKGGGQALYSVEITDFVNATGTFTFTTKPNGSGANPGAGDTYAAFRGIITREELIGTINEILKDLGTLTKERTLDQDGTTKLTFVEDQVEYAIATPGGTNPWEMGISGLRTVEYRSPTTSEDLDWNLLTQWDEIDGVLHVDRGYLPLDGYEARLVYRDFHAVLDTDDDYLSTDVNRMWVVWSVIDLLLENRLKANYNLSKTLERLHAKAMKELDMLTGLNPTKHLREITKQPRTAGW